MSEVETHEGFVLLRQWRDTSRGIELTLWIVTDGEPIKLTLTNERAVMFINRAQSARADERRQIELRDLGGAPVDALYFKRQRDLVAERQRLIAEGALPLEADIKPSERFLMERFVTGGLKATGRVTRSRGVLSMNNPRIVTSNFLPRLRLLSVDIETDGFDGPLLSIAGVTESRERVFLVGEGPSVGAPGVVSRHSTPVAALQAFVEWVHEVDPDVLVGWNVIDFDLNYLLALAKSHKMPLLLGRGRTPLEILEPRSSSQPYVARIPGRTVLDGIATMKNATFRFESFALDDVAAEVLGRKKKIDKSKNAAIEITRMAREDPEALVEYNLEDCRLVLDIFDKAKLVGFALERQRLTGLPLDRQGGSVAAFDQLYLPRLHRAGYVAPSVGQGDHLAGSPGGYVMDSKPGFYKNVLVLDFKSLYPSIIRTFCVDPLGLALGDESGVEGFEGALFAREGHILPELIRHLWSARDIAKRDKDAALSQAIKIIMNSFYGVLGTPGCRFFDNRLVSSITLRGHDIIQRTAGFIERRDLEVIYGDTDSVFVHLAEDLSPDECNRQGKDLAQALNDFWQRTLRDRMGLESHLELEYETHFHRFLMPKMRGSEVGTKKRYAGSVVVNGEMRMVFKGLEAVRTDWTPLARRFQEELFRRVFANESYEGFVLETARALRAGELDEELTYRKRLRRPVAEYEKNIPPHVQAAKKLKDPGREIEYQITINGPEPTLIRDSALDYAHYVERQLAPAADSLLGFLGTSFDEIAGAQLRLFPYR